PLLAVGGWGFGGRVLLARAPPRGMGPPPPAAYPRVPADILPPATAPAGKPIDALICGMAGARHGWMEAPYLDAPADLGALAAATATPSVARARLCARTLPRVWPRRAGGGALGRGEENPAVGPGPPSPHSTRVRRRPS